MVNWRVDRNLHLEQFRTIDSDASPLSNDVGREDKILKDFFVDGRERPASRSLLARARRASGFTEDTTLGNENNVTVREFLLQLASQP
jgi:hypothetical protein